MEVQHAVADLRAPPEKRASVTACCRRVIAEYHRNATPLRLSHKSQRSTASERMQMDEIRFLFIQDPREGKRSRIVSIAIHLPQICDLRSDREALYPHPIVAIT